MGHSSSKISEPLQFASLLSAGASQKEYDYVICGGGTAGCVLASRLSENPETSVLLLEAGKSDQDHLFSRIPLTFARLFKSDADWDYETILQDGLGGRTSHCPRGKMLGGCSSINASVYHRCSPEDFDEWALAAGEGWGYKSLKKYFHKSEHYIPSPNHPHVDKSLHSDSGPWFTSHCESAPVNGRIIKACMEAGVPRSYDFNTDAGTIGVSHFVGTVDPSGQRSSTSAAYLTKQVLSRPNLTVATSVMVEKILLEQQDDGYVRAVGVVLSTSRDGVQYSARAKKEVVLSAGVIGSPQILMLSGLGPREELERHGITPVCILPQVGKSLQDHFSTGTLNLRAKPGMTWDHLHNPLPGLLAFMRWFLTGGGPLAGVGTQVALFARSDDNRLKINRHDNRSTLLDVTSGPNSPDIEIVIAPFLAVNNGKTKTAGQWGLTTAAVLLKPLSEGSLTLTSPSVYDHPIIDPGYLSHKNDLPVLIKATRLILEIAHSEPLLETLDLPAETTMDNIFWPGNRNSDSLSDDDIAVWLRKNGQSPWHLTSTAKMGKSAADSVVDKDLRVHGVRGLRVVDASVFPKQLSGHPCAVVVAVAERASDMIKGII
ncbi:GMC oxidoreductase [Mycena floridula]|nr:GMC oxidoreductase [Mycena floridula]